MVMLVLAPDVPTHAPAVDDGAEARHQAITGLEWRDAGADETKNGEELKNEKLARALRDSTKFTQVQWDKFGISELTAKHFIQSDDKFFKPGNIAIRQLYQEAQYQAFDMLFKDSLLLSILKQLDLDSDEEDDSDEEYEEDRAASGRRREDIEHLRKQKRASERKRTRSRSRTASKMTSASYQGFHSVPGIKVICVRDWDPRKDLGVALANCHNGVFVSDVKVRGCAAKAGLRIGQMVRAINNIPVDDVEGAKLLIEAARGVLQLHVDEVAGARAGIIGREGNDILARISDRFSDRFSDLHDSESSFKLAELPDTLKRGFEKYHTSIVNAHPALVDVPQRILVRQKTSVSRRSH